MTHIFSTHIKPTVDELIETFGTPEYKGQFIEAWLFEDKKRRKTAEVELLKYGVNAKFRSAYKPLLHFFLEDLDAESKDLSHIEVHYPLHPNAYEKRFLLEMYPLSALINETEINYVAHTKNIDVYDVMVFPHLGDKTQYKVFAPNHLHLDLIKQTHLSPTGWLKITDSQGKITHNERLITDYETLFSKGMQAISTHVWKDAEPYFEELNIQVTLPWMDQRLAYSHEVLSLSEALHEDFYFSIQEWFKVKAGHSSNDRKGQPGQIIPEVHYSNKHKLSINIETRPYQTKITQGSQSLELAHSPISMEQIQTELEKIEGIEFTSNTITGRAISARYHRGSDLPVIISGGQHANETTGVVGALRAAQSLHQSKSSHFVISPLENPDGYALHQRLIANNPHHMHHAARYTALGDDLEYRNQIHLYEKEIRHKAREISQANLHINLHGYPSHEWTRPLSGYVPLGFEMWNIPKGFFLILRHSEEEKWREFAEKFIYLVTQKLIEIPGVLDFNNEQISLYQRYAGNTEFRIINGFPCLVSSGKEGDIPLQLITEYPDETLYGEHFIAGHDIQTKTVLAAYYAHQALSSNLTFNF